MWLAQGLALSAAVVPSALAEAKAVRLHRAGTYYEPAVSEPTYPETSGPIVGVYALASAYTIRDRFQGFEHPAARGWIRRPELRRGFRAWLQHDAGELRLASGPAPGGHARHRQPNRSHLRRGSGPSPAGYVESSAASPGVPTYRGSGFVEALPLGGDSLLTLPAGALFTDAQRRSFDGAGYSQGMAFESGTGRVFVSGEAAMFSAQIAVGGMQVLQARPQSTVPAEHPALVRRPALKTSIPGVNFALPV